MERTKNDKKVFILAIFFIIFLGLGISGYFLSSRDKNNNEETSSDRVSLKDDFYENINYRTIKKAKIPSDSGSWNRMYDASKVIEERQEELTNEIISDPNFKNDEIDIMLELYNDYEGRNKRGISELKKYIDMVDNAKSIKEFNKVLLTIDRDLDTQVLFNYSSMNDYYDATKTVLFI